MQSTVWCSSCYPFSPCPTSFDPIGTNTPSGELWQIVDISSTLLIEDRSNWNTLIPVYIYIISKISRLIINSIHAFILLETSTGNQTPCWDWSDFHDSKIEFSNVSYDLFSHSILHMICFLIQHCTWFVFSFNIVHDLFSHSILHMICFLIQLCTWFIFSFNFAHDLFSHSTLHKIWTYP